MWTNTGNDTVNNMADNTGDRTPLLAEEGGIRQRAGTTKETKETKEEDAPYTPPRGDDWDDSLPYGGKVYLARRKKPDPLYVRVIEVCFQAAVCYATPTVTVSEDSTSSNDTNTI